MTERVRLEVAGAYGALVFDSPGRKVVTFDSGAVAELERLLDTLESRRDLEGLVVAGARPEGFVAGADLEELGRIESPAQAEAWLRRAQEALSRLERLPFPTVAALAGPALGGGLELALACTYRVAAEEREIELGLPEVRLGLCPAAGGTWRLPDRVGLPAGLELILSGRRVGAREAHALGLVDEVVPRAALARACERLLERRPRPRRGGSAFGRLVAGNPLGRAIVVTAARRRVLERTGRRFPAPFAILDAVRAGGQAAAEAIERREFGRLAMSTESRALVGLFFASRAARPRRSGPAARTIGVLGAGLMGSGIAQVAARRGRVVRLHDVDPASIGRALAGAGRAAADSRRRHRLTAVEERAARDRLQPAPAIEGLAGCELVVEAVVEDLEVKRDVLSRVAGLVRPDTILASNTSTLPIARLAEALPSPERVLGLHFFSPVPKMPLVEIVRHPGTADEAIGRARAFVGALGKTPIVVRDGPGFYTTRLVGALSARAVALLLEGHSVTEVDAAGERAGFPLGPLALLDEVGLDIAARAARTLHQAFPDRFPAPAALDGWVAEGRKGRKSGRGFYDYGRRRKSPDPEVSRHAAHPTARRVSDVDELADQLRYAMVAEAIRCLEEEIVASPIDGDLGAILGLGFPPETGGPFRLLDAIGAAAAADRLERLAETSGPLLAPPALLRDHARAGAKFHRPA